MAEGMLHVQMRKFVIDNEILPEKEELKAIEDCILALNVWAIPHWDWAESVNIGAVKANKKTIEHILERCKEIVSGDATRVNLLWLNYGWSIDDTIKDWACRIDFSKIDYKEVQ